MAWFWWLIIIGVVAMWVATVVDLVRRRHSMSAGKLAAWVILVLVLPVLGSAVYFLVNTGGTGPSTANRERYSGGPDVGA